MTEELPTAVLGARFSEAVRWASMLHADQAWYYRELRRVLEQRHPDSVVTRELGRVVDELLDEIERADG